MRSDKSLLIFAIKHFRIYQSLFVFSSGSLKFENFTSWRLGQSFADKLFQDVWKVFEAVFSEENPNEHQVRCPGKLLKFLSRLNDDNL